MMLNHVTHVESSQSVTHVESSQSAAISFDGTGVVGDFGKAIIV